MYKWLTKSNHKILRHRQAGDIDIWAGFFTGVEVTVIDSRLTEPNIGSLMDAFDLDFLGTAAISGHNLCSKLA